MIRDFFQLAFGSLLHRKLRSWLTMIGIFIGIASVVALISLGQGMREAILGQFAGLGSDRLVIQAGSAYSFGPPGSNSVANLTDDDLRVIRQTQGVASATGRLIRVAKIEFRDESAFPYVVSLPEDNEGRRLVYETYRFELQAGRLLESSDRFSVLLGAKAATDIFKKDVNVNDNLLIQGQSFKVVGILKAKGNPQIDDSFIINERPMRDVFGLTNVYDVIAARVEPGQSIDVVADRLTRALRRERNVKEGKEDFTIQTPEQVAATFDTIFNIVQIFLIGIAGISIVVGAVGIMNTMFTAVLERTKEIGIMKAIGAKNGDILTIFLLESGLLGMAGGAIGVAIGMGLSKMVEIIAAQALGTVLVKAAFPPILLIGALAFSFLVGATAGVLPARQAAHLQPVTALRSVR